MSKTKTSKRPKTETPMPCGLSLPVGTVHKLRQAATLIKRVLDDEAGTPDAAIGGTTKAEFVKLLREVWEVFLTLKAAGII